MADHLAIEEELKYLRYRDHRYEDLFEWLEDYIGETEAELWEKFEQHEQAQLLTTLNPKQMSEKEKLAVDAVRALFNSDASPDMLKLIGSAKYAVYTAIREKDDQLHSLRMAVVNYFNNEHIPGVDLSDEGWLTDLSIAAGIEFKDGQWKLVDK